MEFRVWDKVLEGSTLVFESTWLRLQAPLPNTNSIRLAVSMQYRPVTDTRPYCAGISSCGKNATLQSPLTSEWHSRNNQEIIDRLDDLWLHSDENLTDRLSAALNSSSMPLHGRISVSRKSLHAGVCGRRPFEPVPVLCACTGLFQLRYSSMQLGGKLADQAVANWDLYQALSHRLQN